MTSKKRVYISTPGTLNYFGYRAFRTPATVFLTDAQISLLAASGVKFEIIDDTPDVPVVPKEVKKSKKDI